MSLPPPTVKIKRKRTDEPVDFLRVHEANGKRQRRGADDFVFELQPQADRRNSADHSQPNLIRTRSIKPLHRSLSTQSLRAQSRPAVSQSTLSQVQNATDGGVSQMVDVVGHKQANVSANVTHSPAGFSSGMASQNTEVRRFHISRSPASQDPVNNGQGQPRKRKEEATVFIERRVRSRTPDDPAAMPGPKVVTPVSQMAAPSVQPQKKPGKNARTAVPRNPETAPNMASPLPERVASVPSALRNRWDVTSEQLIAEMQAYTLQEIGYNIAESEATNQGPSQQDISRFKGPSRFKPRAPTKRYAERHPESKIVADQKAASEDLEMDLDSDDDYVVDTYIRVPLGAMEPMARNIGLLILDSEVDIEEFYRGDDDSDEEVDLEDEDENAENHYSADYPDEEVDSDDEYNRNVYNYRNNASDDEFDATYSDSEDESTKYPWKKFSKPWATTADDEFN